MNERKLHKIFETVRAEPPPAASSDFDQRVMRQIRQEQPAASPLTLSFSDHLNRLFPRLACAAVAMIALCVASDYLLTTYYLPGLSDEVAQISSQWLFPIEGI